MQRQKHLIGAAEHRQLQVLAFRRRFGRFETDIAARRAVADHSDFPFPARGFDGVAVRRPDIHDGNAVVGQDVLEQTPLRRQIGFGGAVIIQMIARQIGERRGADLHAVESVLIEPVARRFHGQMGHAFVGQRLQRAMQVDRIGRGQTAGKIRFRRDDAERPGARRHAAEVWRANVTVDVLPLVPVTAATNSGWRP